MRSKFGELLLAINMILGKLCCFLTVSYKKYLTHITYVCKKLQVQDRLQWLGTHDIGSNIFCVVYFDLQACASHAICWSKYTTCLQNRYFKILLFEIKTCVISSSNQSMPLFKNYSDLSDSLSFIQNKTFQ